MPKMQEEELDALTRPKPRVPPTSKFTLGLVDSGDLIHLIGTFILIGLILGGIALASLVTSCS